MGELDRGSREAALLAFIAPVGGEGGSLAVACGGLVGGTADCRLSRVVVWGSRIASQGELEELVRP